MSLPPPSGPGGHLVRAAAAMALAGAAAAVVPRAEALAASPSRAATAAAPVRADRAAVETARRFLCPHGGAPKRGGRCRGGAGGGAVASAAGGRDESVRGWDAGLPAVTHRQAPCPGGTVQARPLFWDNAVRCVPR